MPRKRIESTVFLAMITLIALFSITVSEGQSITDSIGHDLHSDSLDINSHRKEKSDQFYDSLRGKKGRSKFGRFITRLVVVNRNLKDDSKPSMELEKSKNYFVPFSGREISDIRIIQANVMDQLDRVDDMWIERTINSLHWLTRESVISKNLLFKVGQTLEPYSMAVNEQLLRKLPYISSAFFVITPDMFDKEKVVITVFVRDGWTLHASARIGRASWGKLYDENFLGRGDQLTIKYYLEQKYQGHGIEASYLLHNFLGTFANIELFAGAGRTNNTLRIIAERPFILPNDHIYGFTAGYKQNPAKMRTIPVRNVVDRVEFSAWYGHSHAINIRRGTNVFITTGAEYIKYKKRPDVREELNPFFHSKKRVLISLGLARQNFYQGNMIFGYGTIEDIPYGHKLEITSGLEWSEFYGKRYYVSSALSWGRLLKFGYYNIRLGGSTYFNDRGDASQGTIDGQIRAFSPLYKVGRWYLRHFMNINATWGFNRLMGDNEILTYSREAGVRGVKNGLEYVGYNRLTVAMENVFFAPTFFYHYRFAFNIWNDIGWLGYNNNLFKNSFAWSAGIGVRIHNERLIFKHISLRLGIGIKVPDEARYSIFRASIDDRLRMRGFAPTPPTIMKYE